MFKSLLLKVRVLCLLVGCILSSLAVTAQTRITGRVIGGDDKQGVVGAAVRIKGTTIGTVTDVNGNFTLSGTTGQTLVISYVGYITREVAVTGAPLNITLAVGNNSINEVVVTGYTSQAKKDISGSVATVNVSDAKQLATGSSDQLLQGQAAGVNVVTQGAPGAAAQVYVRGVGNFGNSQPLYVIDGVQSNDGFKDVNANDIESISVLKDAGATAIYGVSGGNGVIVITTKKGKGKSTITYDGFVGTQRPIGGRPFNLMTGAQYEQLLLTSSPGNSLINPATNRLFQFGYGAPAPVGRGNIDGSSPIVAPSNYAFFPNNHAADYLIQKYDTGAGTDWFHAVFKPAFMQSHTLSASGANEKNNYYTSFGYLNQQGTLLYSYYKRYSARANTTFNIKDHVRIGENAQVIFSQKPGDFGNLDEGNAINQTLRMLPIIPVYDIGGNYGGTYDGLGIGNATNPVATRFRAKDNYTKSWEATASAFAEADVFKHLTVRTQYNVRFTNYYYFNIASTPYDYGEGHNTPTSVGEGAGYFSNYNWTNSLNYSQIFGKHNVKLFAGYETKGNNNRTISGGGFSPFSESIDYVNLTNVALANKTVNSSTPSQVNVMSFFARLDYQFNDRYILGATIRRDGTSVFAPGHKFGTFPSISLAWRVSQEDFMKGVSWVNDLKIRGSYGTSGFYLNVPATNAYDLFNSGPGSSYYPIDGSLTSPTLGFRNSNIGNLATTWETDKTTNVGFDATLFGNKLDITAEYYNKISDKLLFQLTLPATVGEATAPFQNIGKVGNKGFDISATYHLKPSNDLSFDIGANITTTQNKILDLGGGNFFTGGIRTGSVFYNQVGHSIGEFYGYKQIGYFNSTAEANAANQVGAAAGSFKYQDLNGDGKIDANDRTSLGQSIPKFNYNLNLNARYKNFDLLAVFYGVSGNKIYNYTKYFTNFTGTFPGNRSAILLTDAWTPTNTANPKAPSASLPANFSTSDAISSYFIESGSFLKLRTLQLGYTFSANLLRSIHVDRARLYIQAANVFTATKYTGLDPEIQAPFSNGGNGTVNNGNGAGIDYGNYPNNERRFLVGASFSF